jgi:hypothetical protein
MGSGLTSSEYRRELGGTTSGTSVPDMNQNVFTLTLSNHRVARSTNRRSTFSKSWRKHHQHHPLQAWSAKPLPNYTSTDWARRRPLFSKPNRRTLTTQRCWQTQRSWPSFPAKILKNFWRKYCHTSPVHQPRLITWTVLCQVLLQSILC